MAGILAAGVGAFIVFVLMTLEMNWDSVNGDVNNGEGWNG